MKHPWDFTDDDYSLAITNNKAQKLFCAENGWTTTVIKNNQLAVKCGTHPDASGNFSLLIIDKDFKHTAYIGNHSFGWWRDDKLANKLCFERAICYMIAYAKIDPEYRHPLGLPRNKGEVPQVQQPKQPQTICRFSMLEFD